MSTPVIMDVAAVGAVFLLTLIGAWRGLWKTLMGIVVFLAAAAAAALIASALSGPLTDRAVAYVMERAEEQIEERMQNQAQDTADSLQEALAEAGNVPGFDLVTETLPIKQIPALLERVGLSSETQTALIDRVREKLDSLGQSTAETARVTLTEIVRQLLGPVIHAILFGLSFMLVSAVLTFLLKNVGNALDEIPAMKTLNHTGGMVLGLAEGVLLLTVVSFLIRTVGLTAEAPPLSETVVLKFLAEHSLLDLLPMIQTRVF